MAPTQQSDVIQSREAVTCQTMRWLRSALVGADCWLAVGSDKPSNSPPSSPEEDDNESDKQQTTQVAADTLN